MRELLQQALDVLLNEYSSGAKTNPSPYETIAALKAELDKPEQPDLRKAAEMALEALEDSMYPQKKQFDAIIELRQSLAQPEQTGIPEFPEPFTKADIEYAPHESWDDERERDWLDLQVCQRNKIRLHKYARQLRELLAKALAQPEQEADLFWDADDTENGCTSIDELINNYDEGNVLNILRAKVLPPIEIKITSGEDGYFDYEIVGESNA